jgi:hypothetical protein
VTQEAYSHEVVSFGFWPGGVLATGATVDEPVLYAYAAPAPDGIEGAALRAKDARWDAALGEFLLPYEVLRAAADPAAVALGFYEDVYEAAATLGGWDRTALERDRAPAPGAPAAKADLHAPLPQPPP